MPISEYVPGKQITVKCACGAERTIPTKDLVLGSHGNADLIAIGTCKCGTVEFARRTFDKAPLHVHGSHHDVHRRVTNALAMELKKKRQWSSDLGKTYESETEEPTDLPSSASRHSVPAQPREG